MEDIQGKVFSDFEVPSTSDGSHRGRKKIVEETNKHFMEKLKAELVKVNTRLKSSKTKVSLELTGGVIQLRATLPLKPDDTHKQGKDKKQYKISLGIPANFDGLKTAEEEAYELGKLIARQTFTWTDKYLGTQAKKNEYITFCELYDDIEKIYFSTRKRTIRSEHTFIKLKEKFKRFFLCELTVTVQNARNLISKIDKAPSRDEAISLASVIFKAIGKQSTFSDLKIKYKKKKRSIPDDLLITSSYKLIDEHYNEAKKMSSEHKEYRYYLQVAYALFAVYGLRPREIVNQPNTDWLLNEKNTRHTFKVHESNKTGYREVIPFVPEWIELFDLLNKEKLEIFQRINSKAVTVSDMTAKVILISRRFKVFGIPFAPYDLRHACAIRAHLQGVPIKAAADNLGHTVKIHTEVYQSWFGLDNRIKAFKNAAKEQNELEQLKDENANLRKRVAELELELTRLRMLRRVD